MLPKKILLVVGSANDIFIYNFAKWLTKSMEVSIDVFEFNHNEQQKFDYEYYDSVTIANYNNLLLRIPKVRAIVAPKIKALSLESFLKNKYYDIIQCHWVVSSFVLAQNIRQHCNKLYITFWGGELETQTIYMSSKLYVKYLERTLNQSNGIINSLEHKNKYKDIIPFIKNIKYYEGCFGSSPLEALYSLMDRESKSESKKKLNLHLDKISILLGYSGKKLHQHIKIIQIFNQLSSIKHKIQFIIPMTRGASPDYIKDVELALKHSECSYYLLKDHFLSDEEVARLRNATDIVLQLSSFDGYSRSIVECLCAESLMLYGNWLEYESRLKNDCFFAIPVESIEKAVIQLDKIVNEWPNYKDKLSLNSKNGKNKNIWSECIKDWVNIYNIE